MREILFRGKRIDNVDFVEGYLIEQNTPEYHAYIIKQFKAEMDNLHMDILECYMEEVDQSTVGQFTGLTDKNGKKIFEGDILALRTRRPHIVKFEDGGFVLTDTAIPIRHADKFDVIGNIHDNDLEDFNGN